MRLRTRPFIIAAASTLLTSSLAFAQDVDEDFTFGDADAFGDPDQLPDGSEGDGVDTDKPPPVNKGVIQGVILDGTGEPAIEAQLSLVGTPYKTITDVDGRYRFEVPPGTYRVDMFLELHRPAQVQNVVVRAGEIAVVNAQVEAEEGAVQDIEVIGVLEKDRLEGQLLARQRSASVGDIIGRHEISKTPDSNAAEAAQRVVGATIVDGRFVYVRGLGERYSNALFDGAPLPSPEPDRAAIPLDLFPVAVIDSITIVKTFTPDLPADFAGGSVQIQTRSIPDDFVFSAGAKLSYVTGSTFQDRSMYQRSKTDWLGFDSGLRALPDGVPSGYTLTNERERANGTQITRDDLDVWARRFNSSMRWEDVGTPPNHSFNMVVGNGWDLKGDQKLGAIASLTYSRGYNSYDMTKRDFDFDDGEISPLYDYDLTVSKENVQWGALGSLAYMPSRDHELRLVLVRSQLAENDLTFGSGPIREYQGDTVALLRERFVARALNVVRVTGIHEFEDAKDAKLNWSALYSVAARDEPDTRDAAWRLLDRDDRPYRFITNGDSGRHFWSDMSERGIAGTVDYEQPLDRKGTTKVKVGGSAQMKDRDFTGRRFVYAGGRGQTHGCDAFGPACSDQTFANNLIGYPSFDFEEATSRSDSYDAELDVMAAYVMADMNVMKDLRLIMGERFEATRQTIKPKELGTGLAQSARLTEQDLLPSVSLVYSATKKAKVRGAYTRTLARPQLRELAPFSFNDIYGGRNVSGNPDLKLTHITNVDMRFEYFPSLREVAAFSIFYKGFEDPIEPTLRPTGGSTPLVTFVNSSEAKLIGLELEARKGLGFINDSLNDFSTIANLTLAKSRISLEQTGNNTITSLSRPLVNQAPWVVNFALDYDNEDIGTKVRASFNVTGRRIVEVGTQGIPDAYEQPSPRLDIVGTQILGRGFKLKGGIEDVLNSKLQITQGKDNKNSRARESYRNGSVIFLGVSYDFEPAEADEPE